MRQENTAEKNGWTLLAALLLYGEVQSFDGAVAVVNPWKVLMSQTEMYHAVRYLGSEGFEVQRIDAGGRPTWRLIHTS